MTDATDHPDAVTNQYLQAINALPEESMLLGEMLVNSGVLTAEQLDAGLSAQDQMKVGAGETAEAAPTLGEILVQQHSVQPEIVEAAAAEEMGGQAAQLQDLMSFFKVEGSAKVGAGGTASRSRASAPAPRPTAKAASISSAEADFERF